jgi:hypothetical protein
MWQSPPVDEVDGIRRQVRRVRRRWNLFAVQRAAYGLVAATASAATLAVLTALVASSVWFVAALAALTAGLVATSVRLLRDARRAWVARARAAAWADRRAALGGRLATIVDLDDRAPEFFRPLLVASNVERLSSWTPERLVPSPMPTIALGSAIVALVLLALTIGMAPLLEPPPLATVHGGGSGAGSPIEGGLASLFRRVLAATTSATPAGGEAGTPGNAAAGATGATSTEPASLADLPAAIQASIRRRLWGERWARVGDTVPGDARARAGAADEQIRRQAERASTRHGDDAVTRAAPSLDPEAGSDALAAGAASGAGTGTDPDLFGPATTPDVVDEGRFALGLAARVRTVQTGPRPPSGDVPDAARDEHPTLALRQRPDAPAHRVAVPPAYATIVRDAFTHRATEGDRHP